MNNLESTTIFTRSWSLYDLITEHNYMFHREIYSVVEDLLGNRDDAGSCCLLDLGCGNARYLAPSLKRLSPRVYEGVDLSEAALGEAREYLAGLPGEVILTHGDLLEAVERTDRAWDVIFSGFAVHHLSQDDKARFFHKAGRCLSKNGWLIIVDVVREENQDRESFLDDYLKFMREKWAAIPQDQLEEACAHVRKHDYPERLSTLNVLAQKAGLGAARLVGRQAQHHILLFTRPTSMES
jgi:SAM-dependent methyltransferase